MHFKNLFIFFLITVCCGVIISCEDFVDIDTPNFGMITENVFASDETADAAMTGIYNQLYHPSTFFSNGWQSSVTILGGISADLIRPRAETHPTYRAYWQNDISTIDTPDAKANLDLWSSAYNMVYLANSVLEGTEQSSGLSEPVRKRLTGQALFVRAFVYFYLTHLYGDAPLLLTTDYRNNALSPRHPASEIKTQIIKDLDQSLLLLEGVTDYRDNQRTNINLYAAAALRARVALYGKDWWQAETMSSSIITQTNTYEILGDPESVFKANSREAIWQLSPRGRDSEAASTFEGIMFVMMPLYPTYTPIILSEDFASSFEDSDKRLSHWIGYNEGADLYFIHKYKVRNSYGSNVEEYSMVLRLAEQYLIRAEARAMQGKIEAAITDVDVLRKRAGLPLLSETNPGISKEELLEVIAEERKKELFAEWGHRWLDLQRTGTTSETLKPLKPHWKNTAVLFPVPEEERMKNPSLSQNDGY